MNFSVSPIKILLSSQAKQAFRGTELLHIFDGSELIEVNVDNLSEMKRSIDDLDCVTKDVVAICWDTWNHVIFKNSSYCLLLL